MPSEVVCAVCGKTFPEDVMWKSPHTGWTCPVCTEGFDDPDDLEDDDDADDD